MTEPADHLLTLNEVAARLRLSARTVQRKIHAGSFPIVRNGRRLYIPASFVDGIIASARPIGSKDD